MNVDDFLKEYEKIKKGTTQTQQKKADEKKSMSVDDFLKQYQQIKQEQPSQTVQPSQSMPTFKTLEEAQNYAKENNINAQGIDTRPTLYNKENKPLYTPPKEEKKSLTKSFNKLYDNYQDSLLIKPNKDAKISELLKVPESWKDNNRRFEDGYQFGDITKTGLENAKEFVQAVGSTAAEIPVRAARDFLGVAEEMSNFTASRIADVNDLQAALVSKIPGTEKYTDTLKSMTNNLRKEVAKGSPFAKQDKWIEDVADYLDRDSFTGKTADMVSGGLGQIAAYSSIGSFLGAAGNIKIKIGSKTLNTPLVAWMTGGGSQDVKNFQMAEQQLGGIENATGLEKAIMSFRSILGGGIESFSEGMFGLFGVGGNEITDQWRNQAIAKANTAFEKWLASFVVAGGGEAIEEVASYVGNYVVDKILDTLNKKAGGRLDFSTEFNWEEMIGEAFSAFLSSGISMGGSSAIRINNITKANQQLYEYQTGKQLNKTQLEQVRKSVADQVLKAQNELDNLKKMYPAEARKQDLSQVRESLRNFGGKVQQNVQEQQTDETQQVPSSQNKVQQNEPQSANSALKTSQIDTQNAQNTIQGLEEYSEDELKNMIADHVEEVTEGNVKLKDVSIKDGKATITYDSDLTENLMEQALNTEPLNIDGVEVRITPVKYENGTLLKEESTSYESRSISKVISDLIEKNEDITSTQLQDIAANLVNEEFANVDIANNDEEYDRYIQRLNELQDRLKDSITKQGYKYNKDNDEYVPTEERLQGNYDINFEYGNRIGNEAGKIQLEKISNQIDLMVDNFTDKGVEISVSHSNSSNDTHYITVKNPETGNEEIIRVSNHFKPGVSGNSEHNFALSDYKTITALLDDLKKRINSIAKVDINKNSEYNRSNLDLSNATKEDLINDYRNALTPNQWSKYRKVITKAMASSYGDLTRTDIIDNKIVTTEIKNHKEQIVDVITVRGRKAFLEQFAKEATKYGYDRNEVYEHLKEVYGEENVTRYIDTNNKRNILSERKGRENTKRITESTEGSNGKRSAREVGRTIGTIKNSNKGSFLNETETSMDSDIKSIVNHTMTMAQAKALIQRTFVANNIKSWYDDKYKNGDEWLEGEGVEEVANSISNTPAVSDTYNKLTKGYEDKGFLDTWNFEDILEAYRNNELVGKEKQNYEKVDTSVKTGFKDNKVYAPRDIQATKELYEKASQRLNKSNRAEVFQARADFIIAVHNKDNIEKMGLTVEEVNKKIKAWANYPERVMKLSQEFNEGVARENQWTGLENSSFVNHVIVTAKGIEKFVKDIKGDSDKWQRNYIAGAMLALDTHIDYTDLTLEFDQAEELHRNGAEGDYDEKKELIRIGKGYQNTVAHEIGHYLDYKWGRELFGVHNSLSSLIAFRNRDKLTDNQLKFIKHFEEFMNDITDSSEFGDTVQYSKKDADYWQRPTEVFARFVGKFTEWVRNQATGNRYRFEELHYHDRFTTNQYKEFVKILQEKSALDISMGNKQTSVEENFNNIEDDDLPFADRAIPYEINNGLYSQVEKVISTKMANKADAQTIKNLLNKNGAKQDELDWLDMDTFLESKDSFTKQEVIDYIRANQIYIDEVNNNNTERKQAEKRKNEIFDRQDELADEIDSIMKKYEITDYTGRGTLGYSMYNWDILEQYDVFFDTDRKKLEKLLNEYDELEEEVGDIDEEAEGFDDTKYDRYITDLDDKYPSGNYREVLYSLPNNRFVGNEKGEPVQVNKKLKGIDYKGPHWGRNNVFAHTRLQDYYVDKGKKKVLFIEEIQSDLHQEGRRKGYNDSKADDHERIEELNKKYDELKIKLNLKENSLWEKVQEKYKKYIDAQNNGIKNAQEILNKYIRYSENSLSGKMTVSMAEDVFSYAMSTIFRRQQNIPAGVASIGYVDTSDILDSEYDEFYDYLKYEVGEIADWELDKEEAKKDLRDYIDNRFNTAYINGNPKNGWVNETVRKEYRKMVDEDNELQQLDIQLRNIAMERNTLVVNQVNRNMKPSSYFPFKKTWHEFVIRKIINEAVKNGYDKVAWTTGKQQNDRYTLSNYIDTLYYIKRKNGDYNISVVRKDEATDRVLGEYKADELENVVGKEVASKIISGTYDKEVNGRIEGTLEGLDLEIGGEGMKGFYDKIIPDYVSKYIKKWGGKLEDVVINGNHQQGFTITPEMRDAVANEGQTLFAPMNENETDEQRADRVRKYVEETQKAIGTLGSEVKRKEIVKSIIDNYGITTKGNSKVLNQVSKEIQDDIKQGKLTDEKIQKTAEDLVNNLYVTVDDFYKANKELKETIRQAKLYASDAVKNGFSDWNDYRKRAIGTVRLTNDTTALPVDTFYKELNEIYGNEFFPDDIVNISDQLDRIVEVAKSIREIDMTLKDNIEQEFGEEARKEMVDGLVENLKTIRENAKNEQKDETEIPDVKQSSWTKTVQKNEMINKFIGDEELKNVKYVVKSNKESLGKANSRLERDGYDETLSYFDSVMKSGKIPSTDDIAVGERLIQESIKNGDFKTATRLIADTSILATELGQAIQATSMINRLSPAGQLMYLERAVRRINEQQRAKRKPQKKNGLKKVMDEGKVGDVDVKITDEMKESILAAQTPEELQRAVDRAKEQIAAQLPVTWQEKLTTLRYLAMLGNPKTHIRNILGNTMMIPLYEYKNFWQRVLETTFDDKLEERTATFKKASKAVNDYIDSIVDSTKEAFSGSGYSNIQSELKNMRKIFKTKILQALNELNSNALEYEDFVFKKRVFKSSLAEYLTANGIKTKDDIKNNQELIQKGINFAVEEAKKATFNQYNVVASAISRFENINGVTKVLTGGIVPFKRTPLNIAKTGWQYSPFGLAETLLWQTHNLKNGFITGNDYIERISQGLTGTSITLLGMLLASLGVLKGSTGSKKKDKYEESIGLTQPYSIRAGDKNVDVSWMSPSAIPLLVGAEFYSLLEEGLGWKTVDDIIQILEKSMNPISEMTMLKTLNDALINYGSSEDSVSGLNSLVDTVAKSYISQAFPTLGNQINKVIDPTIRSTAVSKNSKWKFGEQIARQNANKIIGLSTLLEPSTDIWGNVRKRSDYAVLRGLDAFANPANITKDTSTDVDYEIMSLYDANGNDDVIPKTPQKYFTANNEKYEMSASEYTQYKMTYGQTAYKNLEALFATDEYKSMSVEDSEKAISKVYSEAQEKAKLEFMINRYGEEGVTRLFDEKKINKLNKAKEQLGISYDQYMKAYYAQSGVEGDKGKDGKTISGTKKKNQIAAIQRALPTLSNAKATQLYKIFNGDL